ncbi:MAG: cystathionine beta-lyase [Alphaproteobacteria bacterium]|nr:cystathionine beta-lyase [Alphaproteobacteria bacterium]
MKKETLLATLGSSPDDHHGVVNLPIYRASTILFPTYDAFMAADNGQWPTPIYGRYGTPSTMALEEALAQVDGAEKAIVTSSGLAAIVVVLLAYLRAGDHVLMVDNVYGSTRRFCDMELSRLGVQVEYYDPLVGAGIDKLIKDNTRMVFVETPGSLTFEMQDIPAIAKAAHAKNVLVVSDSTWGASLYFRAFEKGVDINIQSATKYISGHSDLVMGVITSGAEHHKRLAQTYKNLGMTPSGDNCFLALRGLRSLAVRLSRHYENAMKVATWLQARPEVSEVLYPALPGAPGHDIWKRDFLGASSLFGVILKETDDRKLAAFFDGLELFGMGYSWGGYESLAVPVQLAKSRTATKWTRPGTLVRLHIGLEHADDIIADLEAGLKRLAG